MYQVIFHLPDFLPWIGGMPVYGYGVMLVIGFFAAIQLAKFLARHSGMDPEIFVNAGLIALVTGVAGSRLSHVLENWHQYTNPDRTVWANFVDAINIRSGGLTFYGGLLLATPCTIAYGLIKKAPVRIGMDIVAPCVMIGLGFGRIGCYLNGCCYGAEANPHQVPWAQSTGTFPYYSNPYLDEVEKHKIKVPDELLVSTTDGRKVPMAPADVGHVLSSDRPKLQKLMAEQHSLPLHPAQLYSTITAWLIAALLVACYTLPHVPGRIFALMLLLEAPTRYILEMLREEPAVAGRGIDPLTGKPLPLSFLPPQSFSMVLSVGLFILGIVLWFAFRGPKVIPGKPEPGESRPGFAPVPA
jgi:phosphatidylglycerol:prolipoprotein diacylglycerol transferase